MSPWCRRHAIRQPDVLSKVELGPQEHWDPTVWNSDWWKGHFPRLCDRRTMVVKLSDRVRIEWFKQVGPIFQM